MLENGPSSRYARVFDIDWRPVKPELADKVLLPILGDQYGAVLERQEIRLEYEDGVFVLRYFDTTLPVAPRSYPRILQHGIDALSGVLGPEHPELEELLSIVTSLEHLPTRTAVDPERLAERQREKEIAKRRLGQLDERERRGPGVHRRRTCAGSTGRPVTRGSFDLLDELLNDQAYRLAHWRVASEEINYRRFFDINELAAVRMEHDDVFEEVHRLVFALLADGCARRAADRSRGRPVRPGRLPAAPAGAGPRAAARRRSGRSTSWSRRSWRTTSRCRPTGRWTARPGTSSRTR